MSDSRDIAEYRGLFGTLRNPVKIMFDLKQVTIFTKNSV